ncbi:hypothetical protein PROFUN_08285 [Planoprotostelium fungivorum]|uniref:NADP-dependent oxidoreductase domain-containing protein n=1 Tax=Planoprotostelium fungivorum TaxID=1890364 RepID=A0A2P6NJX8_9EUKA|nr:hypothetical protein PROFUN_08285 [Planoprotostelium fungivorum]
MPAKIMYGSFNFSNIGSARSITDPEQQRQILDLFQSLGHNDIDTARAYPGSEEALQERGWNLVVDTKIFPEKNKAEEITESFEASAKALGVDHQHKVNILYLHTPDNKRDIPVEQTLAAIDKIYRSGRIQRFGLSNFTAEKVQEFLDVAKSRNYIAPTAYQGMYNLCFRDAEEKLFPLLRQNSIRFYGYSPLAGGFLANQKAGGRRDMKMPFFEQYYRESSTQALAQFQSQLQPHGISAAEYALRWAVHHSALKGDDGVIIGGSQVEQVKENLDFVQRGPLPQEILSLADELWDAVRKDLELSYNVINQ